MNWHGTGRLQAHCDFLSPLCDTFHLSYLLTMDLLTQPICQKKPRVLALVTLVPKNLLPKYYFYACLKHIFTVLSRRRRNDSLLCYKWFERPSSQVRIQSRLGVQKQKLSTTILREELSRGAHVVVSILTANGLERAYRRGAACECAIEADEGY